MNQPIQKNTRPIRNFTRPTQKIQQQPKIQPISTFTKLKEFYNNREASELTENEQKELDKQGIITGVKNLWEKVDGIYNKPIYITANVENPKTKSVTKQNINVKIMTEEKTGLFGITRDSIYLGELDDSNNLKSEGFEDKQIKIKEYDNDTIFVVTSFEPKSNNNASSFEIPEIPTFWGGKTKKYKRKLSTTKKRQKMSKNKK